MGHQTYEELHAELEAMAAENPKAAILSAWSEVENAIAHSGAGSSDRPDWAIGFINALVKRGHLNSRYAESFRLLRDVRNKFSHGQSTADPQKSALSYSKIVTILLPKLDAAVARLRAERLLSAKISQYFGPPLLARAVPAGEAIVFDDPKYSSAVYHDRDVLLRTFPYTGGDLVTWAQQAIDIAQTEKLARAVATELVRTLGAEHVLERAKPDLPPNEALDED